MSSTTTTQRQRAAPVENLARRMGAITGLVIGGGFVFVGAAAALPGAFTSPQALLSRVAIVAAVGFPTLAAGWLGGRTIGPRAMRARTSRDWFSVIVRLGLLAVLIGDLGVALAAGVAAVFIPTQEHIQALPLAVAYVGMTAVYGLVAVPFVLPITLAAAAAWAGAMGRLRNRLTWQGHA